MGNSDAEQAVRDTGIDVIGGAPWSTHFCQFYETKQDLVDILVPYFAAGLRNNEFCMWVTSPPLVEHEAEQALREALPDLDRYLEKGQIEIIPYSEWYLKDGGFESRRVLDGWIDKLEQAQAKGYDGLRLSGNTFWLEKSDWADFAEYEQEINDIIGNYRMMAACTYSLEKCGATEIVDVISTHQFALIKRQGRWEIFESAEHRRIGEALREREADLNRAQAVGHIGGWRMDVQRNVLDWSDESYRMFGVPLGTSLTYEAFLAAVHPEDRELVDQAWQAALRGAPYDVDHRIVVGDTVTWIRERAELEFDAKGVLRGGFGICQDITERKRTEEEMERALREEQQREAEVSALLEASQAILEHRDFKDAAHAIFQSCKTLIGAFAGYVALLAPDETENEVLFLDSGGLACTVDPSLPMPIRGLRGEAYHQAKAMYENNFSDSEWLQFLPEGHADLKNVLFAPLLLEGKPVGLLGLANKPGGFTDDDLRMASAFGELAAIALRNSRTLEALETSEAHFRGIYAESPIGIELYDSEGKLLDVNEACLDIFGVVDPKELKGFRLFDDPNLPKKARARLRKGESVAYEFPFDFSLVAESGAYKTTRSGVIHLYVVAAPLGRKGNGAITGYLVQVEEVTERVQAQEALRLSEERHRMLTEHAQDVIYRYRLGEKPGYEYVSPAITALTGYTPEECYSDPEIDLKIVHPDDHGVLAAMRRFPAASSGPFMLRWLRKDGTMIWMEIRRTPIYDSEGNVVAIEGVARDISERIRSLEELDRMRNEFLGMVTHELRTPLAAIKGSAATGLGSPRPLSFEETQELLQIIDEQADRLRDLTDNLLDMTRIEAGSLTVEPEPMDLREAIEDARTIFRRSGRSQELRMELAEGLPPVKGDKRRIVQVLTNLVGNAAKFSPPSSEITVQVDYDAAQATVRVTDRGLGIPQDRLPDLFKKFSQVHETGRAKVSGAGLGLAICKGIVEAHGGRIWAESAGGGEGATFNFTLPVAAEVSAAPTQEAKPGPSVRRGKRIRVLAVDDELHMLRHLQHSLDQAGYKSIVTGDPTQVLKLVEMEEPHLVLLDLRLPGISGLELLQRIREFSDVPVIFLTASDRDEDTVSALKMGADDYVTKPFSPSELLARIEAALRRRTLPEMAEGRPPFVANGLEINFVERRVALDGRAVLLSAMEYKLLYELATHAGQILTYDQILQRVWGAEYCGETELVRSLIRSLRRKLGDDAKNPRYIFTERQVGYRMAKS